MATGHYHSLLENLLILLSRNVLVSVKVIITAENTGTNPATRLAEHRMWIE